MTRKPPQTAEMATSPPLAAAMAAAGMDAAALAAAAGVSATQIGQWLSGQAAPRPTAAFRVAGALGRSPGELFPTVTVTPFAAALADSGMTVRALARRLGMHENTLYAWTAGQAAPNPDRAEDVAAIVGVPASVLFTPKTGPPVGQVADRLRSAIASGELAPGAKLPPERELAEREGVSRGCARAALARLRGEGLIATRVGSGSRVSGAPPAAAAPRSAQPDAAAATPRPPTRRPSTGAPGGRLTAAEALAAPVTGDPQWRCRAACSGGGHDPDLWWPPPTRSPAAHQRWAGGAVARRVCAECPVLGDCRDAFLATAVPDAMVGKELDCGIWAGVTGRELRAVAHTAARAAGTSSATRPAARATPEAAEPTAEHGARRAGRKPAR